MLNKVFSLQAALFFCVLKTQGMIPALGLEQNPNTREYLDGDILDAMDAYHATKEPVGVREHIDSLNGQYFGKKKLFTEKNQMEAHARKGLRNKLREKREAKYKEHKVHATRIRNGEL